MCDICVIYIYTHTLENMGMYTKIFKQAKGHVYVLTCVCIYKSIQIHVFMQNIYYFHINRQFYVQIFAYICEYVNLNGYMCTDTCMCVQYINMSALFIFYIYVNIIYIFMPCSWEVLALHFVITACVHIHMWSYCIYAHIFMCI